MKKLFFILLFLPAFAHAQVDAAIDKKIADAVSKIVIPTAASQINYRPIIDSAIKAWGNANLIPLIVKKRTTNQSNYFFIDTITVPLGKTVQFEITVAAVNTAGHSAGSKRFVVISNINGVYTVESDITEAYHSGNILKGTAVSLWVGNGASPYISPISQGVPIVCTPGNNGVLNWTETILKTDL